MDLNAYPSLRSSTYNYNEFKTTLVAPGNFRGGGVPVADSGSAATSSQTAGAPVGVRAHATPLPSATSATPTNNRVGNHTTMPNAAAADHNRQSQSPLHSNRAASLPPRAPVVARKAITTRFRFSNHSGIGLDGAVGGSVGVGEAGELSGEHYGPNSLTAVANAAAYRTATAGQKSGGGGNSHGYNQYQGSDDDAEDGPSSPLACSSPLLLPSGTKLTRAIGDANVDCLLKQRELYRYCAYASAFSVNIETPIVVPGQELCGTIRFVVDKEVAFRSVTYKIIGRESAFIQVTRNGDGVSAAAKAAGGMGGGGVNGRSSSRGGQRAGSAGGAGGTARTLLMSNVFDEGAGGGGQTTSTSSTTITRLDGTQRRPGGLGNSLRRQQLLKASYNGGGGNGGGGGGGQQQQQQQNEELDELLDLIADDDELLFRCHEKRNFFKVYVTVLGMPKISREQQQQQQRGGSKSFVGGGGGAAAAEWVDGTLAEGQYIIPFSLQLPNDASLLPSHHTNTTGRASAAFASVCYYVKASIKGARGEQSIIAPFVVEMTMPKSQQEQAEVLCTGMGATETEPERTVVVAKAVRSVVRKAAKKSAGIFGCCTSGGGVKGESSSDDEGVVGTSPASPPAGRGVRVSKHSSTSDPSAMAGPPTSYGSPLSGDGDGGDVDGGSSNASTTSGYASSDDASPQDQKSGSAGEEGNNKATTDPFGDGDESEDPSANHDTKYGFSSAQTIAATRNRVRLQLLNNTRSYTHNNEAPMAGGGAKGNRKRSTSVDTTASSTATVTGTNLSFVVAGLTLDSDLLLWGTDRVLKGTVAVNNEHSLTALHSVEVALIRETAFSAGGVSRMSRVKVASTILSTPLRANHPCDYTFPFELLLTAPDAACISHAGTFKGSFMTNNYIVCVFGTTTTTTTTGAGAGEKNGGGGNSKKKRSGTATNTTNPPLLLAEATIIAASGIDETDTVDVVQSHTSMSEDVAPGKYIRLIYVPPNTGNRHHRGPRLHIPSHHHASGPSVSAAERRALRMSMNGGVGGNSPSPSRYYHSRQSSLGGGGGGGSIQRSSSARRLLSSPAPHHHEDANGTIRGAARGFASTCRGPSARAVPFNNTSSAHHRQNDDDDLNSLLQQKGITANDVVEGIRNSATSLRLSMDEKGDGGEVKSPSPHHSEDMPRRVNGVGGLTASQLFEHQRRGSNHLGGTLKGGAIDDDLLSAIEDAELYGEGGGYQDEDAAGEEGARYDDDYEEEEYEEEEDENEEYYNDGLTMTSNGHVYAPF